VRRSRVHFAGWFDFFVWLIVCLVVWFEAAVSTGRRPFRVHTSPQSSPPELTPCGTLLLERRPRGFGRNTTVEVDTRPKVERQQNCPYLARIDRSFHALEPTCSRIYVGLERNSPLNCRSNQLGENGIFFLVAALRCSLIRPCHRDRNARNRCARRV
jgi:hypothetical protein